MAEAQLAAVSICERERDAILGQLVTVEFRRQHLAG
jgi:hypothetical protein